MAASMTADEAWQQVLPALAPRALRDLKRYGLDEQLAGDVVQAAALQWLEREHAGAVHWRGPLQLAVWLGRAVDHITADMGRRRRQVGRVRGHTRPDPLDLDPLPL